MTHYTGEKDRRSHNLAVVDGRDFYVVELDLVSKQIEHPQTCLVCVESPFQAVQMVDLGFAATWQTVRSTTMRRAIENYYNAQLQFMADQESPADWIFPAEARRILKYPA